MKTSMSDIGAFLACRRAWAWGSRAKLTPKGGYVAPALALGTGVHYALEHYYRPLADAKAVPMSLVEGFAEWYDAAEAKGGAPPLVNADYALATDMLVGYEAEYGGTPADDPDIGGVYSTEQEFIVRVPGSEDDWLVGTIDGVFSRLDGAYGGVWLVDHKTYTNTPRRDTLVLNQQFLGYTWAAQRLSDAGVLEARFGVPRGTPIHGVLYNGLRKAKAETRSAVPKFMRQWVAHSPSELRVFESHLTTIFAEMRTGVEYIAPGQHCDWCDFQSPCIARQLDEDYGAILEAMYEEAEPRGVVYAEELRAV